MCIRDRSKYGDMNITRMAYPKFQEKLQVCKDILHGFDFSGFIGGSPLMMAQLITGGANFILDARVPGRKDMFLKEAMLLKQSHSLCSSMTTEQERHEAAYMEAVRSTVIKITYGGTAGKNLSLKEINDQINELLKAAVQSEGVINPVSYTHLLSNASQVGVPALARATTTFQQLEVEIPDIVEQHKIVEIFENFRKKMEINIKINNNLVA